MTWHRVNAPASPVSWTPHPGLTDQGAPSPMAHRRPHPLRWIRDRLWPRVPSALDPVLDLPQDAEPDRFDDALTAWNTDAVTGAPATGPEGPADGWHRFQAALARAQAHPSCPVPEFSGAVVLMVVGKDGVPAFPEVTKDMTNPTCVLRELAEDSDVQVAGIVSRIDVPEDEAPDA